MTKHLSDAVDSSSQPRKRRAALGPLDDTTGDSSLAAMLETAALTRERDRTQKNAFIQEHVNTATTRKAYSGAQARYIKFCQEKYPGQANPATVTAGRGRSYIR